MSDIGDNTFKCMAELLAFANHKPFFSCSFQSDDGLTVSVHQICDDDKAAWPATYRVTIQDYSGGEAYNIFDKTFRDADLKTIFSLQSDLLAIDSRLQIIERESEKLIDDESDLSVHIAAAMQALCMGGRS